MTVEFTASDALDWTTGRLAAGSAEARFEGVGIDTRTIQPGQLFVAIRGENHDAHGFIQTAIESAASGLLGEDTWLASNSAPPDTCTLAVADSTTALGALARGHRDRFPGPVVAVTGSNGKTTTKELIHSILSVSGPCLRNPGNLNNEFGLPLSLLARREEDERVVVELGMNHRGEIARLAAIARPNVGVITNIGTAHIEFLGSREEIAEEKGDLVASLDAGGVAVLNHDDALAMSQARRIGSALRTFGRGPGADVSAEEVRPHDDGHYTFRLVAPEGQAQVRVRGLAETTVINALAASAAALLAGADMDSTARGLELFEGVKGRMAKRTTLGGANLVDDTYNANPQSMQSALESLVGLKSNGRGIAVLGDMGELGEASEEAHRQLGRLSARLGVDELFILGENAAWVAEEALASGMASANVHIEEEHETIGQSIQELAGPGDWVLIKGSRAMKMERLVEILASEEKN